jgi:ABC-type Fe3+/spermidine/putrescine transport system ATPase subunit
MIEIDHVSKRYGDKLAVDDVSFAVLRMIVGLDAPTAGTVRVNGRASGRPGSRWGWAAALVPRGPERKLNR